MRLFRPAVLHFWLTLLGALALPCAGHADTLRIAVAANFAASAQEIANAFERDTGHKAVLVLGATGKFYAQIQAGAPFHIFLSADAQTPERLVREGLALADSTYTYAIGQLALYSSKPHLVDGAGAVLRQPLTGKLALADPQTAPYGAAAMQVMQHMGVANTLRPQFVLGASVAQAFGFVHSGNAALGFVAWSQVRAAQTANAATGKPFTASYWLVPAQWHTPLRQDAVLLNAAKDLPAALAFMAYLKTPAVRQRIQSHGYTVPPPKP